MEAPSTQNKNLLEEIREQFPSVWREIPDKRLFFGLLGAWLLLFHLAGNATYGYFATGSLIEWMYRIYTAANSDDGHGMLIPFVILALLWWKRDELRMVPKSLWPAGLGLLVVCMTLHVFGYLAQQPRASIVAMLGGIWVLMAMVWGWRLGVATLFPMVLFIFCVPVGTLAEPLTVPLRQLSTDIAVGVSRHLLGIPVLQTGVQIVDPQGRYHYEVAAACSGIRSLMTLFALTAIYGFVTFRTGWKRALTVAIALPLALVGNVLRLVGIVVTAEAFGSDAGEIAHDWLGFLTFALAITVLIALGWWLREPDSSSPGATPGGVA